MSINVPSGYTATLLGVVSKYEDMSAVFPLEAAADEGALMLMRLEFAEAPSSAALAGLEEELANAGVPKWSTNDTLVYQEGNNVYIAWVKGMAWMPLIIGILVVAILPLLLGGLIWWLLPQSIKDMVSIVINIVIIMVIMKIMMGALKGSKKTEPKQIEEARR